MRKLITITSICCVLILACLPTASRAANLTTTNVVGSGSSWVGTIWKTNSPGQATNTAAAVSGPIAGNTYETVANFKTVDGIGNNLGETRLRNPVTVGQPQTVTFAGDSLTLWTNTEIRFKLTNAAVAPFPVVCSFPGVGGNPGLILKGGLLNAGDPAVFPITGVIQAAPGTQSYLCPGNNDLASVDANRGFNIAGQLTGSGTLVIIEAGAPTPTTSTGAAQTISGANNTFNGQWLVKAGWLLASGADCLGTNSITMDQNFTLPVPPFSTTNLGTPAVGPALLELGYNINSAGALTLINGGRLRLHQHGVFSSVLIEGNPLSAGTHPYSELVSTYPANIDPNGSGSLTVQPFGSAPVLAPIILTQPLPQTLYAGQTAHFNISATAFGGVTYRWRTNGVNLADGGRISGSGTASLSVSGVGSGDANMYDCVVTAGNGGMTTQSGAVALSLATLAGGTYESAVLASNAVAYYELNETTDPSTGPTAYDYVGGHDGTYGTAVQNGFNGIPGPKPSDGFPGMRSGNTAASFSAVANAFVTLPGLNLNTNTVTITAWIHPVAQEAANAGIVFCRGADPSPGVNYATTVAGLNYTTTLDPSGNPTLGYTWNNFGVITTLSSGLVPPVNQWSFVALSVGPTNATVYVLNTNGLLSRTLTLNHANQSFAAPTLIGDDSADNGAGTRAFVGSVDEVAVFKQAFTRDQIIGLYGQGGVPLFAPSIGSQPVSQTVYEKSFAQLSVIAGGSTPLTFQWKAGATGSDPSTFTNVLNSATVSGATTTALSFSPASANNAADYLVIITNTLGAATSSVATLTITPVGAPETIIMTVQQASGNDWNTGTDWSDGNPASVSAVQFPGSTYMINPPGRMRSPAAAGVITFPATNPFAPSSVIVNGNGVFVNNNPPANAALAEIRFKNSSNPGTVIFQKLVMNGGQLDAGSGGLIIIGGEMDILTNTPIYVDSGGDATRPYQIDAWLTGTGTIEYHAFANNSFNTEDLNITGTSNTFSGTWNIVQGALLGSAPNALGPGNILIGINGALETTYDVTNATGNLYLNGVMYLHQNDTFHSVVVGTNALTQGLHTFSELNANFPAYFPASWAAIRSSTNTTGSGSINVLAAAPPAISQQPLTSYVVAGQPAGFTVVAVGGQPLSYQWLKNGNNLTDAGTLSGSTTAALNISAAATTDDGSFSVIITNSGGSVTSTVAVLTVVPMGPAENITLTTGGIPVVQPAGSDWNTVSNWSDGYPASISAVAKPNSTYEVVIGALLRSPAGATNAIFPGNTLTVDGAGVFDIPLTTAAELRFKHANPGTNFFKKLVMNGGQMDNGDNGTLVIAGEMDILANTTLYVDSAAGQERAYEIDAWLTGNASIQYYDFDALLGAGGGLTITCASNTFSGPWHVAQGVLLGSGVNSLGTNSITVDSTGALETLYDVHDYTATLTLDGQMFLHQNDSFANVVVSGTALAPGTYTFAQLNAAYPANFPAAWTQQNGSTFNAGSGSLIVGGAPPLYLSFQFSAGNLQLSWSSGTLLEATNVMGPWATNNATSPYTVVPNKPQRFYRVQLQ